MSWVTVTLNSSIGKKVIMSLTGLFLISFLLIHMIGNLQLLNNDNGEAFNLYALFMTTNPVIKTISILLYSSFLIHIIYAIVLTIHNRRARPVKYAYEKPGATSSWASRNMGLLGAFIFLFLVIHLRTFWYEMHWGQIGTVDYNGVVVKDLYTVVTTTFAIPWYTGLYVLSMALLAFHLAHGFQSAFQTLGLEHKKYTPLVKFVGLAFSVVVPALFALQPIVLYLRSL